MPLGGYGYRFTAEQSAAFGAAHNAVIAAAFCAGVQNFIFFLWLSAHMAEKAGINGFTGYFSAAHGAVIYAVIAAGNRAGAVNYIFNAFLTGGMVAGGADFRVSGVITAGADYIGLTACLYAGSRFAGLIVINMACRLYGHGFF